MSKYAARFMERQAAQETVLECLRAQPGSSWVSIWELRVLTNWPPRNGPGLVELNTAVSLLAKRGLVEFRDGWDVKANLPARVRLIASRATPARENP